MSPRPNWLIVVLLLSTPASTTSAASIGRAVASSSIAVDEENKAGLLLLLFLVLKLDRTGRLFMLPRPHGLIVALLLNWTEVLQFPHEPDHCIGGDKRHDILSLLEGLVVAFVSPHPPG